MSLGGNSPFGVSAHVRFFVELEIICANNPIQVSNSGSPMQMSAGGTPSYGASPVGYFFSCPSVTYDSARE